MLDQSDQLLSPADSNLGRPLPLPPGGQTCVIYNLLACLHCYHGEKALHLLSLGWKVNYDSTGCSLGENSSLLSLFSLFFISFRFKSLIKICFHIDLFWLSLLVTYYFLIPVGLYVLVNVLDCFFSLIVPSAPFTVPSLSGSSVIQALDVLPFSQAFGILALYFGLLIFCVPLKSTSLILFHHLIYVLTLCILVGFQVL